MFFLSTALLMLHTTYEESYSCKKVTSFITFWSLKSIEINDNKNKNALVHQGLNLGPAGHHTWNTVTNTLDNDKKIERRSISSLFSSLHVAL